jgi:hypothetical protein
MGGHSIGEPSDEQLIQFARDLFEGSETGLGAPDILEESVLEAREFWLRLYRISQGKPPPQT